MTEQYFTAGEIEILGKGVNSLGIMGSQILLRHRPELYLQAHANLRKCRKDSEELLKRLDHMARQSKDESALRIIEDLDVIPEDAAQSLTWHGAACWPRPFWDTASPPPASRAVRPWCCSR